MVDSEKGRWERLVYDWMGRRYDARDGIFPSFDVLSSELILKLC